MKITLDLETCVITAPKNFFDKITKENEIIEKAGGTPISYKDRLAKALETALANTDKYLQLKK